MNLNSYSSLNGNILLLNEAPTIGETQPKQARSIARRQVLLDYGVGLFNERGLDEISIQDITREVGFSTGSFYSYFADKKEYFVAVQTAVAAQQDARAAEVFDGESGRACVQKAGWVRRLKNVGGAHHHLAASYPPIIRNCVVASI